MTIMRPEAARLKAEAEIRRRSEAMVAGLRATSRSRPGVMEPVAEKCGDPGDHEPEVPSEGAAAGTPGEEQTGGAQDVV